MSDLILNVGANATGLQRGLEQARGSVQRFGHQTQSILTRAFTATAILAGLRSITRELDNIAKLARRGIDTDFLQDLSLTARRSGTDLERTVRGIERFTAEVNRAGGPTQQFERELNAIGLTVADLQGKSPEQLFEVMAETIGGLESETDQLAAVTGLLGNRYSDLLPLIQEVYEDGLAESARVTRDVIQATEDFNDAITNAGNQLRGFLAPVIGIVTGLLQSLIGVLGMVGVVIGQLIFSATQRFREFSGFLQSFIGIIRDRFMDLGNIIRAVFTFDPNEIRNAIRGAMDGVKEGLEEIRKTPLFDFDAIRNETQSLVGDMQEQFEKVKQGGITAGRSIGLDIGGDRPTGRVAATRERTGARTPTGADDTREMQRLERETLREQTQLIDAIDRLRDSFEDPRNMAVSSIQAVGGGGTAVGPNFDRVAEINTRQLTQLQKINAALEEIQRTGGLT